MMEVVAQKGLAIAVTAAFFTLIGVLIKSLLPYRMSLIENQGERIDKLERMLALASEELRVVRHDLANANQTLELFISLIEANPEKAAEHAAKARESMSRARDMIAGEKAAVMKARVASIGGGE